MKTNHDEALQLYKKLREATEQFQAANEAHANAENGFGVFDWLKPVHLCNIKATKKKLEAATTSLDKLAKERPGEVFIDALIGNVFETIRTKTNAHENAYHPAVLNNLSEISAQVSALSLLCPLYPAGFWNPSTDFGLDAKLLNWPDAFSFMTAQEIPALVTKLQPQNVDSWIRVAVAKDQQIAKSQDFRDLWNETSTGAELTVQHALSGMRTKFSNSTGTKTTQDAGNIGVVVTKPNSIPSICDESPDTSHIVRLSGLGIGKNLYLYAAKTFAAYDWPNDTNTDFRWKSETTNDGSKYLRKKLHTLDPYIWDFEDNCDICQIAGILKWREATRADFKKTNH